MFFEKKLFDNTIYYFVRLLHKYQIKHFSTAHWELSFVRGTER